MSTPMEHAPLPAARHRFTPELVAAAAASSLALLALYAPLRADWLEAWRGIADLYASVWIIAFVGVLIVGWAVQGVRVFVSGGPTAVAEPAEPPPSHGSVRLSVRWAAVLLGVCAVELLAHAGERNGWVASSRPASGVETWTTADGYAALFDGVPAQGDGAALLPMLRLFTGEEPPSPSEFDRRAGHVYLASLLQRPLGTYWAFAALNLLAWWAAALAVWWLGRRRWPGTAVPPIAALLTATGQGFAFVAGAPQAHGAALAAFAVVLVLADRAEAASWAKRWGALGWASGCAGLLYLAHVPALLFTWLYTLGRAVDRRALAIAAGGAFLTTVVALAIVQAWQVYGGTLLGLRFSGGNNDLVGEAARGWVRIVRGGSLSLVEELHSSSLRGLLGGAFYYPWWLLAAVGLTASGADNRRWSLAVIAAALLPAIAFWTRFNLPRVAYFCYPAVYLLAARGIEAAASGAALALRVAERRAAGGAWRPTGTWVAAGVAVALVVALVAIANVDLTGNQQLNLWFHYSQGDGW